MSQAGRSLNGGIDYVFNFLQFLDYISNGNASFYVNTFGDVICNSINIAQTLTVTTIVAITSIVAPTFQNAANSFSVSNVGDIICRNINTTGNITMNAFTTLSSRAIINTGALRSYKFENTSLPNPTFVVNANGDISCKSVTMTDGLDVSSLSANVIKTYFPDETGILRDVGVYLYNIVSTYVTLAYADSTYSTIDYSDSTYLKATDAATIYLSLDTATMQYLKQTDANTTYLPRSTASDDYLKKTDASDLYLRITAANDDYLKKTDASALYLTIADAGLNYYTKTASDSRYVRPSNLITYVAAGTVTWNGSSWATSSLFNLYSLGTDDGGTVGRTAIIINNSSTTIRNMIFVTGRDTSTLSSAPVCQGTPQGDSSGRAYFVVETYNVGGSRVRASFQFMII